MIDKATAEKIKESADIVEVVSDYVHLTRRGANFMGLCPFHNERTPSFSVNKIKNFCYCFSCHKGGSPVNFIMEKEGISYQDALRQLARKYGIKIEERELSSEERQAQSERESMFVANEWAMNKFCEYLTDTDEGRNVGLSYLYERGVTDESIRNFKIGYAPDANVLESQARQDGFNVDLLITLGLLGRSENGRVYDRFRSRIIFPVLNAAGKVVAFGGRDLKGAKAKYINSPETPVYHKSNELYGLHQARTEMGRQDNCYLVEGYMDVIGMWQSGIKNAIASSGTALTDAQIALIHRFTHNVTLVYDGDAAGIKASLRGIDMLLAQGMDIKVLLLPEGHDPDSFSHKVSPEEFRNYFESNSSDFISFKTQVLLKDSNDPLSRTKTARSIVESLGSIPDKIKRNIYIQECSRLLGIDEQVLSYETDSYVHHLAIRRHTNTPASVAGSSKDVRDHEDTNSTLNSNEPTPSSQLILLERNLARLCVRYGMMPFVSDDRGEESHRKPYDRAELILDYVERELKIDGIELHDKLSAKLIHKLYEMRTDFKEDEKRYENYLLEKRNKKFEKEISELSMTNMSIPEIELAERKLQEKLDLEYNSSLRDYAASWPGKILISHEDDELRIPASEMIADHYVLSRYHHKTGTVVSEADRLPELLPRALNELRAGMIEQQIIEINNEIGNCNDDAERCMKLMKQLSEIQQLRKDFAYYNGERILATKSISHNNQ